MGLWQRLQGAGDDWRKGQVSEKVEPSSCKELYEQAVVQMMSVKAYFLKTIKWYIMYVLL